jgi:peptide/nickel transport system substrate-binding protein
VRLHLLFGTLLLLVALAQFSCRTPPSETAVAEPPPITVTSERVARTATDTPTVPPQSGKHLAICMSEEPSSLYWHGASTLFDRAVLHGLYENDLTSLSYRYQPRGLERVPSLANGGMATRVVPVDAGELVVDARGDVVALEEGVQAITADGETVTFEGNTLLMEQQVVDFVMKQRFWADGQPVTASDSVYSFALAADPDTPGQKGKIERTDSYQATGNLTVRWAGLPGFRDNDFQTLFQQPLPRHAWEGLSAAELITAEASSRLPVGDGPYMIVEWVAGESIRLEPNPYYYRAQESLPRVDSVTFKFIADNNQRLSQLLAGECHIVTHDGLDTELIPFFDEAEEAQLLKASTRPGPVGLEVTFGVNSWSDYGDGAGRPDWFEDVRVRQAMAMCVNRQQIVNSILYGRSDVAHSTLPDIHPLYAGDVSQWPFDLSAANALLDEVGFLDNDEDGIREDPITGNAFRVSLITGLDQIERRVGQLLQEAWRDCGIDLVIEALPDPLRLAGGEDNRLIGRRFDLVLTSSTATNVPQCDRFSSWQIGGPLGETDPQSGAVFSGWDGSNHTGWSDPAFDVACASALEALPGTPEHILSHQQAQNIFSQNLPLLPLFYIPRTTATSPEVPHINNDPSQNSELWNLFALDLVQE